MSGLWCSGWLLEHCGVVVNVFWDCS